MLNVVIPMAGRGSRFLGSPELVPKPLIEVESGRPMISYVVEHLRRAQPHRFIFVARAEHAEQFELAALLELLAPGHELVLTDTVTGGPLATTLLAGPSSHPTTSCSSPIATATSRSNSMPCFTAGPRPGPSPAC